MQRRYDKQQTTNNMKTLQINLTDAIVAIAAIAAITAGILYVSVFANIMF